MNNLDRILSQIESKANEKIEKTIKNIKIGKKGVLFLISPMGSCNFSCLYCSSYGYASKNTKMLDKEKIYKLAKLIIDFKNRYPYSYVNISFHGYEPLQYPFDAFETLDNIIFNAGYHRINSENPIRLSVQTNGYLLDEEKIKFFYNRKWSIGISIDGPKEVHDAFRKTKDGKDTYDIIIHNINIYRKYFGKSPGIISVFTKKHLEIGPDKYYDWLLENKFTKVDIHVPLVPDGNPYVSQFYPNPKDTVKWFHELYEIWKNDKNPIDLHPFVSFINALVIGRGRDRACFLNNGCYKVIELGFDGKFRLCDRWSYITNKTIDNIEKLEDIFYDDAFKTLFMRPFILKRFNNDCSNCKYFSICLGGCSAEAKHSGKYLFNVMQWAHSPNCYFIKNMYDLILKDLENKGYDIIKIYKSI
ncbi:MAG: radical SAM protein [Candidatus Aenigmatarchaeota archaeon]